MAEEPLETAVEDPEPASHPATAKRDDDYGPLFALRLLRTHHPLLVEKVLTATAVFATAFASFHSSLLFGFGIGAATYLSFKARSGIRLLAVALVLGIAGLAAGYAATEAVDTKLLRPTILPRPSHQIEVYPLRAGSDSYCVYFEVKRQGIWWIHTGNEFAPMENYRCPKRAVENEELEQYQEEYEQYRSQYDDNYLGSRGEGETTYEDYEAQMYDDYGYEPQP